MDSSPERCDVLFLIRSLGRGGAERQLSLLARRMHAHGLKVVVAVFYTGGEFELELKDAGVELLDLRKSGRWSNLAVLKRLRAFVRRRHPRILHAYMPPQNLMALLLRPWLSTQDCAVVCGIRTALPNSWRYDLASGLADFIQVLLLSRADRIISNSALALKQLRGRIGEDLGVVIPNGMECERYEFDAVGRSQWRAGLGCREEDVLIGLVGRLDPIKNHALLIDAISLMKEGSPQLRLVFVGEGTSEYREQLQAYARKQNVESRILWVGPSDEMAAIYSALDILCLCSRFEGFPNVLAEAMCVGLPCVTTDVGDARILVGDCGWVVPPGDPQALAHHLLEASHALPTWNRGRPRDRVMEHFSADELLDRTLDALSPWLDPAQ